MSQKRISALGQTLIVSVVAFALGMTLALVFVQTQPLRSNPQLESLQAEDQRLQARNADLKEERDEELNSDDWTWEDKRRYGWVQTSESPNLLAEVRLTIPGVFADKVIKIGVKRLVREENGTYVPGVWPTYSGGSVSDGVNEKGGFGASCFLSIKNDDDDPTDWSVVLKIDCSWTTPDQVRGSLNDKVKLRVGVPTKRELPDGAQVTVTWQDPTAKDAVETE